MSSPTFELKNEIYKAGAGAGKTTKLTAQVIDVAEAFYQKNQRHPHIVVTTFTRKATQELKERLVLKACEDNKLNLLEYFSSQQKIHISTIHGVLSLFLRRYGHLFELDNNFELIDKVAANSIFKDKLRTYLKEEPELLEFFSFSEILNNTIDFYPLYFENIDLKPPTVEFLKDCLKKRWSDFKTQILKSISAIESQSDNQKWLDYVDQIKKSLGLNIDQVNEALSNLPRAPIERKNKTVDEETKKQLAESISSVKKMFKSKSYNPEYWPALVQIYSEFYKLGKSVSKAVMQEKIQTSNLEMQDLELLTLKIIREEPEIAQEFSKEWDYWLVDEYQDTSPIQVEILKQLISDRPHFTVGDPQQSIYLFRGADVSVFENKQDQVLRSGGDLQELMKNYRSDPELLEFFNDTFTKLSPQFMRMEPKNLEFNNEKIVADIFNLQDREQELEALGSQVIKHINSGASYEDICILARKNDDLIQIASHLESIKIPFHLHQSSGFNTQREIIDLCSVLKFFVNPYDNHNLLCVLRSPWFRVKDDELIKITQSCKKQKSYWSKIKELEFDNKNTNEVINRLKTYILNLSKRGFVLTLEDIVQSMLDWSFYQDSSGLKEANIFKFIYQLKMAERQPNFNIIEFLTSFSTKQNVEEASSNSNATSSIEPLRVQLMTVHASKGLQFKYVLLPFLGVKPKSPSKSGVLFDKSSGVFSFAVNGVAELERFGSPVEDIIVSEQKIKESQEFLRVFYVALTRAKEHVYLSWSVIENNSWAEKLQHIFTATKSLSKYSYAFSDELPDRATLKEVLLSSINKPNLLQDNKSKQALSQRFSVSDILALESNSQSPINYKSDWKTKLNPVLFGIEFHAWLESYKYNPEQTLEKLSLNNIKIYEALMYLKQLDQMPFDEICKNGNVEWGFQMKIGTHVVEGQVDLWGSVNDQLWVVDYKTGSSKSYKKSLKQLHLYALAIHKLSDNAKINLVAVYPFEQKVFVEQAGDFNQLEEHLLNLLSPSEL